MEEDSEFASETEFYKHGKSLEVTDYQFYHIIFVRS